MSFDFTRIKDTCLFSFCFNLCSPICITGVYHVVTSRHIVFFMFY